MNADSDSAQPGRPVQGKDARSVDVGAPRLAAVEEDSVLPPAPGCGRGWAEAHQNGFLRWAGGARSHRKVEPDLACVAANPSAHNENAVATRRRVRATQRRPGPGRRGLARAARREG